MEINLTKELREENIFPIWINSVIEDYESCKGHLPPNIEMEEWQFERLAPDIQKTKLFPYKGNLIPIILCCGQDYPEPYLTEQVEARKEKRK